MSTPSVVSRTVPATQGVNPGRCGNLNSMARYDGHADWYDAYISTEAVGLTTASLDALVRMLGRGAGRCLDVGCGTGIAFETIEALGWSIVGIDLSHDQLRIARERADERVELVHGDAADLPF